jgi:putative transposase
MEDHIHMLVDIHPSVSLADFIRETKADSSRWLRENGIMPGFEYWQEGYGGFTKSWADKDVVIEYIKGQEEHHRKETFLEEFRRLVEEAGMEWDDRFLP